MLDPGRLLDLEASLLRDERRFDDALARLDEALPLSLRPGHILVKKGTILEVLGDYEQAIEILLQAEPWVDRETEPRLWYQQRFNLGVVLCNVNRCPEAAQLVEEAREIAVDLGDAIFLSRVTWLQGRIAAGLGQRTEARALLERACREFASRKMWYNVLLAQLEGAALLLEEGRDNEVKPLARKLATTFRSKGIHREALAALRLFHGAAQREEATAELARQVLDFLLRARYDNGLVFSPSKAGATIGVRTTPVVENGTLWGTAATAGIGNAAILDERTTPERRNEAPQLPEDRQARRRGEKRGGKDDRNKSWTHETVSRTAPGSGLRGPRGPRLPGMVRQVEEKNPDLRGVDKPLRLGNSLTRLFRALSGRSQVDFGQEAAEREKATAELARRVLRFLFRSRWDERLQFNEAA